MAENNLVKVLFGFYSDALEEWTIETMWCELVDPEKRYYKIENVSFYGPFAYHDLIFAEYDEAEEMLTYRETVAFSGHSTIQVVLADKTVSTDEIIQLLQNLGGEIEKFSDGYFVINIPPHINYKPINAKLIELQKQELIDYAESCLDEGHGLQISAV